MKVVMPIDLDLEFRAEVQDLVTSGAGR